ncbi:MAG TPA: long-chain-fatty-acid--CoA ligase [Trebonia sp.]
MTAQPGHGQPGQPAGAEGGRRALQVNIYPAESEAVLTAHPAVGDVAVIGVPDAEWGESVKAVVELADGYQPSDELGAQLIAFCRERLAGYKCPRSVDFIAQLPRTDGGKLFKRLLRDEYRRMAQAPQ